MPEKDKTEGADCGLRVAVLEILATQGSQTFRELRLRLEVEAAPLARALDTMLLRGEIERAGDWPGRYRLRRSEDRGGARPMRD